jgi:hypothetical protein
MSALITHHKLAIVKAFGGIEIETFDSPVRLLIAALHLGATQVSTDELRVICNRELDGIDTIPADLDASREEEGA